MTSTIYTRYALRLSARDTLLVLMIGIIGLCGVCHTVKSQIMTSPVSVELLAQ